MYPNTKLVTGRSEFFLLWFKKSTSCPLPPSPALDPFPDVSLQTDDLRSPQVSGAFSIDKNRETELKKSLVKMDIATSLTVVGGLPAAVDKENPSATFAKWAPTVRDQPMPVQYTLAPLTEGWKTCPLDKDLYAKYLVMYAVAAPEVAETRWNAESPGA